MRFNSLLDAINRKAKAEYLEHKVGHLSGLDLEFKGYTKTNEILDSKRKQVNGKTGDIIYIPNIKTSRPYYGYDTPYDPTILNAIRYNIVDVSGLNIPNNNLSTPKNLNTTLKPLKPVGIIK